MKISGIMLLVLMGLTPIIIFVSLIVVPPQIKWQPPQNWRAEFGPVARNAITALSRDTANVYASGYVGYSSNPSNPCQTTPCYVFLKKFSLSGLEIWTRQLGLPNNMTIDQIQVGTDGIYLTGYTLFATYMSLNTTGFAEKFDFNGTVIWKTSLGSYAPTGLSLVPSGLYSVGLSENTSTTLSYFPTLMLKKVDLNGNLVWTRALMNQTTLAVGRIYASTSGVYIAASDDPYLPNPDHGFVSRYDLNGILVWTRLLNMPLSPVFDLSGDSSGVYLGGWYLRKYDFNGNIMWTTGTVDDLSISASNAGVFLIGKSLQKYDLTSGNLLWSFQHDGGEDLVLGEEDQVLAAGTLTVFGPAVLTSYQLSSSLIIAGINPPYSFLLLIGIVGGPTLVILEKRRRTRRTALPVKNKPKAV